ncbi:haloacid dehalogenase [Hypoxylon fragiforme]|uniref:haloacid dehalogenase n=1 Tax=Hypoxylon fragiforme TaxID=63214 RepID=UPI0020C64EB3|nr:haloacid dehalogenase [Hypoxylon fragiforme]KAI2605968.1 haloacid dehalogenase [Hypoxylon fragiforme]
MTDPVVPPALRNIKALTFDVFGTVVDWRSTVEDALAEVAQAKVASPTYASLPAASRARLEALTADDWARFAQEWRASYHVFTSTFVPGETAWKDIDAHHLDSLRVLLRAWGLADIFLPSSADDDDDEGGEEVRSLSLVWHRLRPWADSAAGIRRLGTRLQTATLSNGNQSLLRDLDAHGGLGFRRIISTADFGAYKPHPSTYLGAAAALGARPDEVAMVAAHLGDLAAARELGFRTIYVERPGEEQWGPREGRYREAREEWVDLWVAEGEGGFEEVARRLGIPE